MKNRIYLLLMFVFVFSTVAQAQITPFYTFDSNHGSFDKATGRLLVKDNFVLPDLEDSYPLSKNVRNWVRDFFNLNTKTKLSQEFKKNYQFVESFYEKEFTKKTTPNNEKMGMSWPLLYSNKYFVTYKVMYGHDLNGVTYKVDVATFLRDKGTRITVKDIFNCDENTIKILMFGNLPKGLPCDIHSANEIKIISAGINRKTIDVVGTIYKENTAVYEIPFEVAEEYLTENAYRMHGPTTTNKGTIFSDDGMYSFADRYFTHLLRKSSLSFGVYHNINLDKDFVVQLDKKYNYDKDGELKNKDSRDRVYIEIPSDDDNKEAYIEFSRSDAKSFIDDLNKQLNNYISWKKKMQSQKFVKYKLYNNSGGKTNISFYRHDDNSYGYEENIEFVYQNVYYKKIGTTAFVVKSGKKTGVVKKLLNLGSTAEENINMELSEDKLSGWTLIMNEPEKEIPELCEAIQNCIDKMK